MTQQTENTRSKISFILSQVGMSDEELYQLLYGRKQQVEIDIRLPQLMDEEIWQATEHSEEELGSIESKLSAVEMLLDSSMDSTAIAQLETLLEGEVIPDDARGLLLKKRFPNWRKGIAQFLAFLHFSALVKLALAMASVTANHLMPKFENAKNRPQDRRMLSDFILQQLEQPSPPMIAALAAAGGVLSHTGELSFLQPMTAAIIGLDGDKLAKIKKCLEKYIEDEPPHFMDGKADDPQYKSGHHLLAQQNQKTSNIMNKLIILDRVEELIANQQALQPPPQQQQQDMVNPQQQEQPRRRGSAGRRQREAQERQEREAQEQRARMEVENPQPSPRSSSFTRFANRPTQTQIPPQPASPPPPPQPQHQQATRIPANNPSTPSPRTTQINNASASQTTPTPPVPTTTKPVVPLPPNPQEKLSAVEEHHHDQHKKMANIFADLPLDALKGLKMESIDHSELGKKKASIAKDNPVSTQAKPIPQLER